MHIYRKLQHITFDLATAMAAVAFIANAALYL